MDAIGKISLNLALGVDLIPSFVPYLLLIIASIVFFLFSWVKARSSMIIPYYICIAGTIYIFELIIFIIFNSYTYHPGLLKDPFYDSALGAIVSNGFIVPSTCTLVAVYGISFGWILILAAGFMGIELTFIHLGIFEHHWWKVIYTGIGIILLFSIGKWLWHKLSPSKLPYLFRLILLYTINVSLQGSVIAIYLIFFHQIVFQPGWFEDPSRDNIAFATLIVHIDSVFFALLVSLRGNWIWKMILIGLLGCGYLWLIRQDILYASSMWSVILLILLQIIVIQLLSRLYRVIAGKEC
ncbi:hypothetical protein PALU110988_00505 [Paenibacillus lupini]